MNASILTRSYTQREFYHEHNHHLEHHDKIPIYGYLTALIKRELRSQQTLPTEASSVDQQGLQRLPQLNSDQQQIIKAAFLAIKLIQEGMNHAGHTTFNQTNYYGTINQGFFDRLMEEGSEAKKWLEIICCHRRSICSNHKVSCWKTNYTKTASDLRTWLAHPDLYDLAAEQTLQATILLAGDGQNSDCAILNLPDKTFIPPMDINQKNLCEDLLNNYAQLVTSSASLDGEIQRHAMCQRSSAYLKCTYRPQERQPTAKPTSLNEFQQQLQLSAADQRCLAGLNNDRFDPFRLFKAISYDYATDGSFQFERIHPVISYLIEDYSTAHDTQAINYGLYQRHLTAYQHYISHKAQIDLLLAKIYAHYGTLYLADRDHNNQNDNFLYPYH